MTIGKFQRLRERTSEGPVIHVDAAHGNGYTLCGYAYEGSCVRGENDSGVEPVSRGKINCVDCLRIIWHCEYIPRRVLAPLDSDKIVRVER
jgi:hypothetical protein